MYVELFTVFSYCPFDVYRVCIDILCFIPNIGNVCLLSSFIYDSLVRNLSILLIFSKSQVFCFIDFSLLKSWHISHLVMRNYSFNIFFDSIS